MAGVFSGGSNTYVPNFEASGKLVVDFSRNSNSFALNRYVSIIPTEKETGLYLSHTHDESARSTVAGGEDALWVDGGARPENYLEKEHEFLPYYCVRYAEPFTVGDLAAQQAVWDVVANKAAAAVAKQMTRRSRKVIAKIQDTAVMVDETATNLSGGKWDVAAVATPYIKKTLMKVGEEIHLATNGVVGFKDLILILNPNAAHQASESAEIHDYLKSSPFSMDVLQGNATLQNWGLPSSLYGVQVVVEDTVLVTSKKKATRVDSYAMTSTNAVVVARPGGIATTEGTFSTVALFMKEELNVEVMADATNRRTIGSCIDHYDVQVVSPVSGYLITALID